MNYGGISEGQQIFRASSFYHGARFELLSSGCQNSLDHLRTSSIWKTL